MPTHEGDALPPTPFQQSAAQLLGLLSMYKGGESGLYCSITWSEDQPGQVASLVPTRIEPTGARRQVLFGESHRAQLKVDEFHPDGTLQQRFVWCPTPPQRTGEDLVWDDGALASLGYIGLTSERIINVLASQAVSLDDFTVLVEAMQQHGIQSTPELAEAAHRMLRKFIYSGSALQDPDAIINFVELYSRRIDEKISKDIQSKFVAIMLKTIRDGWRSPEHHDAANAAAAGLVRALSQELISRKCDQVDTILSSTAVYAYPFATRLLYTHLHSPETRHTAMRIFGAERTGFIYNYVVMVTSNAVRDAATKEYFGALPLFGLSDMAHDSGLQKLLGLTGKVSERLGGRSNPSLSALPQLLGVLLQNAGAHPVFSKESADVVATLLRHLSDFQLQMRVARRKSDTEG